MDKLQYIQNIMPNNAKIQVESYSKDKWFIYYGHEISEYPNAIIYTKYTDDLDKSLNEVIDIIMKEKLN